MDFTNKARDFLKKFWNEILTSACDWWKENKDKDVAKRREELVAGIGAALKKALPSPWNMIAGILALIAVIIIRAGINMLCTNKPSDPPSVGSVS